MEMIWLIALVITHGVAFCWGYTYAQEQMDDQTKLELEKYKFDKFYEHQRWLKERDDVIDDL